MRGFQAASFTLSDRAETILKNFHLCGLVNSQFLPKV